MTIGLLKEKVGVLVQEPIPSREVAEHVTSVTKRDIRQRNVLKEVPEHAINATKKDI